MRSALAIAALTFALIAGYFIFVGFTMTITVTTDAGDVANLQMMHLQATNIAVGIGAAIVSAIFTVGAALVPRDLDRYSPRP